MRRCKVLALDQRYYVGQGRVEVLITQTVLVNDILVIARGEVLAICLRAHGGELCGDNILRVEGLLLVETKGALYRRLCCFSADLSLANLVHQGISSPILHEFRGQARRVRQQLLKREGGIGPGCLERLGKGAWTRQTVRII